MPTLNLGILAHVDAGKTSLTERLLYAAGVIDAIGTVDDGSTQTDSLALERQRGITIRSAVVSFAIGGVTVNLIDTPGHPDFIAEVERVLNVLDGAVLVVSAVEGVQAQTRVLMRTLRRLRLPTLIFVNKIDRRGAREAEVLRAIGEKLTPAAVPMGTVTRPGERDAGFAPHGAGDTAATAGLVARLAEHDDALLAAYLDDDHGGGTIPHRHLRAALAAQTRRALIHPVYFGSAITGAGVDALSGGIAELLPTAHGDPHGPVAGTVFKVERGPAGEKIAYVRMVSGTVRARDWLRFGAGHEGKVTGVGVFDNASTARAGALTAGQIGTLRGLGDIRIGDTLTSAGRPAATASASSAERHHFAPPTLETVVVPRRPADRPALHTALTQLAEQDPLINLRRDDLRHETSVSLYGEVQKQVIEATLAEEFGLAVEFRDTTTICVERPVGTGTALETAPNPFEATVGLRVEPAPPGSGVRFALEVAPGSLPAAFFVAVEDAVRETLRQGPHGWEVVDCAVTMTHAIRWRDFAGSTPADHRHLTPLVVADALRDAGTRVHEPMHRFRLEIPPDTAGAVLAALASLGAVPHTQTTSGQASVVEGAIPAARVHRLRQRLAGLTRGEGVLESEFDSYQPVRGTPPTRPRTDNNPFNRDEYLLRLARRTAGRREDRG